jgi:hypothetical protein
MWPTAVATRNGNTTRNTGAALPIPTERQQTDTVAQLAEIRWLIGRPRRAKIKRSAGTGNRRELLIVVQTAGPGGM